MKVELSSAEFKINENFVDSIFEKDADYYSLKSQDLDKINMWPEYREEISFKYNNISTCLKTDKYGQDWIMIGGTGWANYWTVDASQFKNESLNQSFSWVTSPRFG